MLKNKKGLQSEWVLVILLVLFVLFLILKAFDIL